ncbi:hypothetical protein [Capnocytophaga sputigena]|uniref:hypothetical protein n=1 Tax=Capnocytophaga sputigena TaxID=1019 RepID=UPI0031F58703
MNTEKKTETPLILDIRSCSYNPEVKNGNAPITIFDLLQWLRYYTHYGLEPNVTADGTIYLTVSLRFNNGYIHREITKWDIRYPYLDQQPEKLLKDIANCDFMM